MFRNIFHKSTTKPVAGEPFYIGWPGYEGEMDWGSLFVMQWPKEHPNSHCEKHAYTPDEDGICVCGWMPADKICCTNCKELLRYKFEKMALLDMINESTYDRKDLLYTAYCGYVDKYSGQLTGTPDLKAVVKWYNKLSVAERLQLGSKYQFHQGRMVVKIHLGSIDDLDKIIDDELEALCGKAPKEVLMRMVQDTDVPKKIRERIELFLEKGKKKE